MKKSAMLLIGVLVLSGCGTSSNAVDKMQKTVWFFQGVPPTQYAAAEAMKSEAALQDALAKNTALDTKIKEEQLKQLQLQNAQLEAQKTQ